MLSLFKRPSGFSPNPAREFLCPANPDPFALALEGGRVRGIGEDLLEFSACQLRTFGREIKLGQLHASAWIRMIFGDALPDGDSGIGFAKRGESVGERHQREGE